jgi:transcriptional/translational regulatory protein YebC/TACO1
VGRPANTNELGEDGLGKVMRLIDALEDLDDVQKVSANFEADDAVMEAVLGG